MVVTATTKLFYLPLQVHPTPILYSTMVRHEILPGRGTLRWQLPLSMDSPSVTMIDTQWQASSLSLSTIGVIVRSHFLLIDFRNMLMPHDSIIEYYKRRPSNIIKAVCGSQQCSDFFISRLQFQHLYCKCTRKWSRCCWESKVPNLKVATRSAQQQLGFQIPEWRHH